MKTAIERVIELWEKYKGRKVRVIAFPVTPTPIGDLVYKPDCFMSRVFDHQALDNEEIVGSAPTRNGPAFLAYLSLSSLMDINDTDLEDNGGVLEIHNGAYCARTSYYNLRTLSVDLNGKVCTVYGDTQFATEADIHGLSMISRSCNAGSHFIIPQAPFLTALVHLRQGMELDNGLEYLTSKECENLFPQVDFSKNLVVDNYVKNTTVHKVKWEEITSTTEDEDFRWVSHGKCLDPYDKHCLRELGRNFELEEEEWQKRLELL